MAVNKMKNKYEKSNEPSALGKLFHFLSPKKKLIIFAIVVSLLGVAANLAAPMFTKEITQILCSWKTYGDKYAQDILFWCLLTVGAYLLGGLFQYIAVHIIAGIVATGTKDLRKNMTTKINRLPMNYFDTRNIGDVLSYFSNDVDIIGTTLNASLSTAVSSIVTILGVVVILFILSWQIALIVVVVLPIGLWVVSKIAKASEKQFSIRQDSTSKVSSQAEESYAAYNIVRVFRSTERFRDKFSEVNFELEKCSSKADFLGNIMEPLMKFMYNVILAGIAIIGGAIAYNSLKDEPGTSAAVIGLIVAAINYANQIMSPLSQLATTLATLQQTSAAAGRVFAFLEEENEPDESHKTATIADVQGNIEFNHVKFGYNKDRIIIHDFSEKGKHGQKIAIVGPTGAGKTTMVNLLMRFYELNSGNITIDGVNTKDMNRSYCRSLFGMVLQDTWLFEGTIMENLKYSRPEASDEEVYAACKATHCDEFIRQQPGGYNHILNEDCGLSAGQKQLLTIARAMVQNAPMLILDEATSNIDTRTELLIQDAMDQLMKGRTSFVIAHRLSTIKNSDLIIVMRDGDVIETGNHDELMKMDGFYAALYNAQFSGNGPQFD